MCYGAPEKPGRLRGMCDGAPEKPGRPLSLRLAYSPRLLIGVVCILLGVALVYLARGKVGEASFLRNSSLLVSRAGSAQAPDRLPDRTRRRCPVVLHLDGLEGNLERDRRPKGHRSLPVRARCACDLARRSVQTSCPQGGRSRCRDLCGAGLHPFGGGMTMGKPGLAAFPSSSWTNNVRNLRNPRNHLQTQQLSRLR